MNNFFISIADTHQYSYIHYRHIAALGRVERGNINEENTSVAVFEEQIESHQ